ncbi:KEOPS complex subunit Pcc1 [Halobellus sp. GM3]|uniref:KEOPS complex subunit Pcc1 n=1 Tax=Halobellus sp. GM3 TaxID=3458410 RepID=UPI00403D6632
MASREASADGADHEAAIDFEYADERRARVVAESVRVEVDEIVDERSRAGVERDGRVVRVDVAAADLVAFRAGLNTWMRLVAVAEDVAADASDRTDRPAAGEP